MAVSGRARTLCQQLSARVHPLWVMCDASLLLWPEPPSPLGPSVFSPACYPLSPHPHPCHVCCRNSLSQDAFPPADFAQTSWLGNEQCRPSPLQVPAWFCHCSPVVLITQKLLTYRQMQQVYSMGSGSGLQTCRGALPRIQPQGLLKSPPLKPSPQLSEGQQICLHLACTHFCTQLAFPQSPTVQTPALSPISASISASDLSSTGDWRQTIAASNFGLMHDAQGLSPDPAGGGLWPIFIQSPVTVPEVPRA